MNQNPRHSSSHDRRSSRTWNRPFDSPQKQPHRNSIETHSSIPDRNDYESRQYAAEPRFSDRDYGTNYNMNDYGTSYMPPQAGRNTSDHRHWTKSEERRQEQHRDFNASSGRVSFAGRGPKGYKRADTRIEEEVCDALLHDPVIDATDIDVTVKDGMVTLSGHVPERRMKRLAEDCAEHISGVTDVRNELMTKSAWGPEQPSETSLDRNKTSATNQSQKPKTGAQHQNVM